MSHIPATERAKVTAPGLRMRKGGDPIVAITAYDYPSGRLVDEAGVDLVLVGDSAANVVLGYESTIPVTIDEMLILSRAVRRGIKRALVVGDLPFGTYHESVEQAVRSAIRFVKEGGVEAVKLEGGRSRAEIISRLVDAEIPVLGHIGLTPQSVHKLGGYRVQGKTVDAAKSLLDDAFALQDAGVFALVLEAVPSEVARMITRKVEIPTIGIGAGPHCDGQILVYSDLIGLSFGHTPKFVRKYADVSSVIAGAVARYVDDVHTRAFPSEVESYGLSPEVSIRLGTEEASEGGSTGTHSSRAR
jgi:3-methyl-2-oxobutanoate hydroxymethyltransferase